MMKTSQQEASRRYRREAEAFLVRYWGLDAAREAWATRPTGVSLEGPPDDWRQSLLPALTLEPYRSGPAAQGGQPL